MSDIVVRLRRTATFITSTTGDGAQWVREAADEIERLREALRPFCEADWYAMGNGKFEGKVSGKALDTAKMLSPAERTPIESTGGSQ